MNIVLIGYRGSGKSTVAKVLSRKTGMEVISTDAMITEKEAADIPRIVQRHGWDYFRDVENEVIREVSALDNIIVDAGGGAVLREENRRLLKNNGVVFWLTADVETITRRIRTSAERPSLTGDKSFLEEAGQVLQQRIPLYEKAAHHTVKTDGRTPDEIAGEIIETIKKRK